VLRILELVRQSNREQFSSDIDLVEDRTALNPKDRSKVELVTDLTGGLFWPWQVAKMVGTPRRLKAVIRRYSQAWERLHGEVDVDELLVATVLRVCSPGAFGALKEDWRLQTANDPDYELAGKLLQILAPATVILFSEKVHARISSVQSFADSERSTYRNRIFDEELLDGELQDQTVLHAIIRGKKDECGRRELAKSLEQSSAFLNVFLFFQPRVIEGNDLWRLARELYAQMRGNYGRKASNECSDAFLPLTHLCEQRLRSPDSIDEIFQEIALCIPNHLHLAADIHHYLFPDRPSELQSRMTEKIIAAIKEALSSGGPAILAQGLDDTYPALLHLVLTIGEDQSGNLPIVRDWRKWSWLGPILLSGLKQFRDIMAPQIACAIGLSLSHQQLQSDFTVNESLLNDLFGTQAKELMKEMAKPFPLLPEFKANRTGDDYSLVNPRAQRWLASN